jgi:hypothetical protein
MNLSNKHLGLLLSPFLIGGSIYFFSEDIVENLHFFFPEYESYKDTNLNKKADTYLKIEAKDKIYKKIQAQIKQRKSNAKWIADNILYIKHSRVKTDTKHRAWEVQMLYPKKNVAIINNKIVKVNEIVDNAKVISIETSRVLIQHDERLEWLSLFK